MNRPLHEKRLRRQRKDREGVVLLVTAVVLLLVSATAIFALQSGVTEVRAAGMWRTTVRTGYVADSFVMAGLSCIEDEACLTLNEAGDAWRDKYGVPPRAAAGEVIYEIRPEDVSDHFMAEVAPTDSELSGGDYVSAYSPNYRTIFEKWTLQEATPTSPKEAARYIATCYGELSQAADFAATGETRGLHETISSSRAYYTKR